MNDTTTPTPLRDECYAAAWRQPHNDELSVSVRAALRDGFAQIVVFQPGDGTRYRFLLVPDPITQVTVSGDYASGAPRLPEWGGTPCPGALLVTVFDGLGGPGRASYFEHVVSILPSNGIDGIRHRISEKMRIGNPCTAEALAQTVWAVWSDEANPA